MDETATTSGGTTAGPSKSTVTKKKTQGTTTKKGTTAGPSSSTVTEDKAQEPTTKKGTTAGPSSSTVTEDKTQVTNTKRIVILGKTGAGKSSLVNTIFGKKLVKIDHTFSAGTKECQAETRSVNGRNITLIDTPGFFDTNRPEEELKRAIVRSIVECAPGPHAFLIVLKVEKFTEHEESVISKIKNSFSDDVFKYATVVFTHGDQLNEEQRIEDLVCQNQLVSDLVEKCGGRCHVIDNKYWNGKPEDEYRCNQFHVEELLKTIDNITEAHQGGCYTNKNLKAVEREKQQEEEHIRQSSGNISEGEIREQAKGSVFKKLLKKLAHIATGALLGAFYGVLGSTILTQGTSFQAAGTGLGTFAAGGVGAMFGGIAAYDATDEEDTLQGGTERATQTVTDGALFLLDKVQEVVDKVSKIKKSQK
uniref:GTPase IMAP family member 7-like isoform X2 n=1 Tax=Epinephelus lanceolatus TaxID=310571 RepID=UPI001445A94E|nr:GTPase IMAP family member 7-like isoform X2 [Epinephelus lanceolatus]XP_033465805.1 GTPase IMAP family member 7-like isoform X3 [Epinephelus lanceolatus]